MYTVHGLKLKKKRVRPTYRNIMFVIIVIVLIFLVQSQSERQRK